MTAVLVAVHLLAATVWVGGSTALIFVGVPAIRILEGDARGRAMKELGLRWRPLGYGALLVAATSTRRNSRSGSVPLSRASSRSSARRRIAGCTTSEPSWGRRSV